MRYFQFFLSKCVFSILLAGLFFAAMFLFLGRAASVHAECVDSRGTQCRSNRCVSPSTVDDSASIELYVPLSTTMVISDTFMNRPVLIGPNPPGLIIGDVIIDGHLVISDGAENYGPVYVNGWLSMSGVWNDQYEEHYACDPKQNLCVDSSVHGYVTNRGHWKSDGYADMPFGLTNDGVWENDAEVDAYETVINRGQMTNTGKITVAGVMLNNGEASNPGLLVNQGKLFNWGVLTGAITNDGVIYSTGVLSATIDGDGSVYLLDDHIYLPYIRR